MISFYNIKDLRTVKNLADFGNFASILLCEKGKARILLNNRIYLMVENTICIIPPFSSLKFIDISDDIEGWMTKMDMEDVSNAMLEVPKEKILEIRMDSCRHITELQMESILSIKKVVENRLDRMDETGYFTVDNVGHLLKKALCYEVIQVFIDGVESREISMDRGHEIFNIFMSSVREKFDKERSVTYYAEEQCLSAAHFSAVIKEVSGHSAKFWIENLTYISASHYLNDTKLSIKEIAQILNFPDQSSFGKYFKKISGRSPADYRKNQ